MVVALGTWLLVLNIVFSIQTQVLVISTCNYEDLRGLSGLLNGLESSIDGWWSINSSSLSCCNLKGITCDSSSGRIVELELIPSKRLTGNLTNSVLSNLNHLRTLNLSNNFLSGPLPNSLFHHLHLEVVDLSGNNFNGVLPISINLPSLQVLDISENAFGSSLPSGLCINSSRIRALSFDLNHFNGIVPPSFGNCTFLEHLSMDSNRLSGYIPDFFYKFPYLSYFSAESNNLSGVIPPSLSNSPTISSLNLRKNSFSGSVNFNCSVMVNLTSLDLGSNNFSGTIPANLSSCRKLKAINLARNKLTGQIPESFKNFESLSYLSLSNCSFNNLLASLRILQHCPNLTVLVLTTNFYGEQLPSDDNILREFKVLKALVIADCMLIGSIPSWLSGLTHLQLLDLSWNNLTGSIPPYMGTFKYMFYLDLSNNSLSGEIPKNITQLKSLISKQLSSEEHSLYFPFSTNRNLSNPGSLLQYNQIMRFPPRIDLGNNLLTGKILPEFGNLKMLHVLDLKHNKLSGTIPSSLSGMRNIETLDLSYNGLTGSIPLSLVKLSFLSRFSVAYNNLTGIIPSGGQLSTFSNTSFEGNPGLCGELFFKCWKNQDLSQTDSRSEDNEVYILRLLALIGFGTGFLLTVISLLVVPRIKNRY